MKKALLLALVAGAAMAAPAMAAPYTFTAFNSVVTSTASFVSLSGAPAGTYNSYSVSVEWSAIAGDPWSNEAIFAFTDANSIPSSTVFYADPGVSPVAANNGNARTLTWSGLLDVNYTGGNPLFFAMLQTFGGSSANWNNISITLDNITASAPTTLQDFGAISGFATTKNQLAADGIHWYSFQHDGANSLAIDTLGSSLAPDNDTEIGLFAADGTLIATNDDIDFNGGNFLSALNFAAGDLASGTYYIAAGGFNTAFTNNFGAVSTSTTDNTGSLRVNITVPAPAGAGVLALAGLVAARRRRN